MLRPYAILYRAMQDCMHVAEVANGFPGSFRRSLFVLVRRHLPTPALVLAQALWTAKLRPITAESVFLCPRFLSAPVDPSTSHDASPRWTTLNTPH